MWQNCMRTVCLGSKAYHQKHFDIISVLLHAVVNKAKMLSAGVAEAVLKFLRSEMPPVQFKLLGTLRMLIDAQGKNKLLFMLNASLSASICDMLLRLLWKKNRSLLIFFLLCFWSLRINLIHMQSERNVGWFLKALGWLPWTIKNKFQALIYFYTSEFFHTAISWICISL